MEENHSILIIEDEEITRNHIKNLLKTSPYKIYDASNITDASTILINNEIGVVR